MPRGQYLRAKRPKQARFCEPAPTSKRVTVKFDGEPVRMALRGVVEFVSTNGTPVEVLDDAGNVVKRLGTNRDGSYSAADFYFSAPPGWSVRGAAGEKCIITYQLAAIEENS